MRKLSWIVVAIACGACSNAESTTRFHPVELATDSGPPDSGCARVATITGASACRADWDCADGGTATLVCAASDAGLVCACVAGDASTTAPTSSPCDDQTVAGIAASICGWSVP